MNTIPTFFAINTNEATGKPTVNAVSGPAPVVIVKAVPNTVPEIISGGILELRKAPIANSNVAPKVTPVCNHRVQ